MRFFTIGNSWQSYETGRRESETRKLRSEVQWRAFGRSCELRQRSKTSNAIQSMKFKPTNKIGGVIVELGPQETRLPEEFSAPASAPPTPFKLKKILVPVDFSECSKKALQYALPLARQFDAELTLLHVVQPYPAVPEMYPVNVESSRDAEKDLKTLRRMTCDAIPSQTLLRVGP